MEKKRTNIWLELLRKDLLQHRYNLIKNELYSGLLKIGIDNLLKTLDDYSLKES